MNRKVSVLSYLFATPVCFTIEIRLHAVVGLVLKGNYIDNFKAGGVGA